MNKEATTATFDEAVEGQATEVHQTLPKGIALQKNAYGYGVFATEFFPKDSVVYIGQSHVILNKYAEFHLFIEGMKDSFLLDTITHSVQFTETERYLYLFDSFMNHSCGPNTKSRQTPEQRSKHQYQTVAIRDIQPGDEITCDYNLFEYDCEDKCIEKCLCGSSECIGRVAGFKFLTLEQMKKKPIDGMDSEVFEAMANDPSNKFIYITDLKCPTSTVEIQSIGSQLKLLTKKAFNKGDIVYSNESLLFPEDHAIVFELNSNNISRMWVDNALHTVNKGNGMREFFYFDSFQHPSNAPNTFKAYNSITAYDLIATRDIQEGEQLTMSTLVANDSFCDA